MRFKLGAAIPVGTVVYKKAYTLKQSTYSGLVCDQSYVITGIVTKPGFVPTCNEDNKCRVAEILVTKIENLDGTTSAITELVSGHDTKFKYKLYSKARSALDKNKSKVCTRGIHVFLSKKLAREW